MQLRDRNSFWFECTICKQQEVVFLQVPLLVFGRANRQGKNRWSKWTSMYVKQHHNPVVLSLPCGDVFGKVSDVNIRIGL